MGVFFEKHIIQVFEKISGNQAAAPALAKYRRLKFRGFINQYNTIFHCFT